MNGSARRRRVQYPPGVALEIPEEGSNRHQKSAGLLAGALDLEAPMDLGEPGAEGRIGERSAAQFQGSARWCGWPSRRGGYPRAPKLRRRLRATRALVARAGSLPRLRHLCDIAPLLRGKAPMSDENPPQKRFDQEPKRAAALRVVGAFVFAVACFALFWLLSPASVRFNTLAPPQAANPQAQWMGGGP